MYRQIRWPLAYARIGLLYDYDYTHLHVYANVLDLLREVKNIVRQLSRVIPGRRFPKTVASRIGGFDGPWHARVHKFLNDYIHMRVYAYRHASTDVPTHADTRRDPHRDTERETRTQQLLIVWRILEWPVVMHARWTKNDVFFCTH